VSIRGYGPVPFKFVIFCPHVSAKKSSLRFRCPPPLPLLPYSRSAVIHRWRGELPQHSPQPAVNNCAPPKLFTVNNFIFTCTIAVNTPGPEDECCCLNARRLTGDFRSGPGALMQRNSQSLSPASQAGGDEPSIRTSILQGLRVQNNEPQNI
jgi:hypothetical protein